MAFETLWFHVKNAKYFIKNHEGKKKSKIVCKVNNENILQKTKKTSKK